MEARVKVQEQNWFTPYMGWCHFLSTERTKAGQPRYFPLMVDGKNIQCYFPSTWTDNVLQSVHIVLADRQMLKTALFCVIFSPPFFKLIGKSALFISA